MDKAKKNKASGGYSGAIQLRQETDFRVSRTMRKNASRSSGENIRSRESMRDLDPTSEDDSRSRAWTRSNRWGGWSTRIPGERGWKPVSCLEGGSHGKTEKRTETGKGGEKKDDEGELKWTAALSNLYPQLI